MESEKSIRITNNESKPKYILWIIAFIGLITFSIIFGINDLKIAQWASSVNVEGSAWKAFGDFMDDEGQYFAYGWVGILLIIYLLSFIPQLEPKLKKYRKYCAYVFLVTVLGAVIGVRFSKTFFARPRPGKVLSGQYDFAPLLTWGGLDVTDALSGGSFCSGHTSTAGIMFTLPFVFSYTKNKKISVLTFSVSLLYTICMGLGRVIHGAHWASDTLYGLYFMLFVSWFVYKHMLKIPKQEAGEFPNEKQIEFINEKSEGKPELFKGLFEMYEIGLVFTGIFVVIFALITALGIKTLFSPDSLSSAFSASYMADNPNYLDDALIINMPIWGSLLMTIFGALFTWFFVDWSKRLLYGTDFKDFSIIKTIIRPKVNQL